MKILLFTHKNDIDGMGNVILARLAFEEVNYELCGTFDLTKAVEKYINDGTIYDYDMVYVTDLCLEEPVLSKVAADKRLSSKIKVFDHHKTFDNPKYTNHKFVNVQVKNDEGLCCGTSLFYNELLSNEYLAEENGAIREFVELTRQHDTWEWKSIYKNEKARELAILFDSLGYDGYIALITEKLASASAGKFDFNPIEETLIANRKKQITEKCKFYSEKIIYKDVLGLKAGIVFITYEYRNELAEYFKENNFDMDFTMMIALDPGVVCYRSVKDGITVRPIAEHFGGKGHERAASNSITESMQSEIIKILTKTN